MMDTLVVIRFLSILMTGVDYLHLPLWNIRLPLLANVVWSLQCTGFLSKVHDGNLLGPD